jgi:antitoxin component YwqK of YwqJK toxin-antitoxin module
VWKRFKDGKQTSETTYVRGKPHGRQIEFGSDGTPTMIGHWDLGVRHGAFEYWRGATLLGKAVMDHDTGEWIAFRDGKLVEKGRLVNGKREGAWEIHEGDTIRTGTYVADRPHGRWSVLSQDRKTKHSEGDYKDGKRHGAWTLWRTADGKQIVGRGTYAADERDGTWQIIVDDQLVQTLVLRAGKLVTVDGQPAGDPLQRGYKRSDFPELIVPRDPDGLPD